MRNGVWEVVFKLISALFEVYGDTKEEAKARELETLHTKVRLEFKLNAIDPFSVSPRFSSLFTKKLLANRLEMDRDSLSCWLHSVEEAKRHQLNFRASLTTLGKFFMKKQQSPCPSTIQHKAARSHNVDSPQQSKCPINLSSPDITAPLPPPLIADHMPTGEYDPGWFRSN